MTPAKKKEEAKVKPITFKCKACGETKPLDEMMVVTRFFPPMTLCRDCEKKVR